MAPNIYKQQLHLFGVADGHGPHGHIVSNFIKVMLPVLIKRNNNLPMSQLLKDSFETLHKDLGARYICNPEFSGSTLCVILMQGHTLFTANSGDSRAILVSDGGKVTQLTQDQKPNDPIEFKRIIAKGGRVH